MSAPPISYLHLARLSDDVGVFEHAELGEARIEHGYCVDDVARGLIVAVREPRPDAALTDLAGVYLRFVIDAQAVDGRFHNRRGTAPGWQDLPSLEDCWGRALWGLGSAVAHSDMLAPVALAAFERSAHQRSAWTRSMVFAGLGAAEVLSMYPDNIAARLLLRAAAQRVGRPTSDPTWRWPEPRLRYANAALAEVVLAAGALLDDPVLVDDGLVLLRWLVETETRGDHLSVTPVGGWARGETRPGFDQQPIEVAALADAAARAFAITGDGYWSDALLRCAAWFSGANDVGVALVDADEGSSCDGLERHGRNENRGAESTLAVLTTFQQASRILVGAA